MMRGLIFVAALISCSANLALAQHQGAPNRYAQPAPAPTAGQTAPQYRVDPMVQQAAVANTTSRSPRNGSQQAARTNANANAKKSGSTSFFSRFKLPSFSSRDDEAEEQNLSDAPLPYDPAELQVGNSPAPSRQQQQVQPRAAVAAPQVTTPRQAAAAPNRPATGRAQTQQAIPSAPQVTRSSPVPSHRRNELAEALSGLTASADAAPEATKPEPPQVVDADIAPPEAIGDDELPSYLQDSAMAKRAPSANQSLDVGEALRSSGPSRAVANAAPQRAVSAPIEADELAPMPATTPSAPQPRPAAVAKRDIADAFRDKPAAAPAAPAAADASEYAEAPVASKPTAAAPVAKNAVRSGGNANANANGSVLFTSAQPVISSFIEGPQRIVVGRPAEYRVTVENTGSVAARGVTGTIAAPAGAELVDASASNGTVERPTVDPAAAATAGAGEIRWNLYELPAGAKQTLTLQLIPRGGREMQLGVQWDHAPIGGQATVEIQEPKLVMEISGPSDVLFGQSQRYALTLSNPGNGVAEEVMIELTPPGADKTGMVKHKIGTLAAGESKKIELELTAREAGELRIQAAASALGDLRTETTKSVLCRKAELQVDWRGPEKKYAGAIATYFIRVRNPGTAAAEEVAVELTLPSGAELVEASTGHAWDEARQVVVWQGATLNPGEERFMELQCRVSQPGVNKLELAALSTKGNLRDAKSVPLTIEGIADLKLEVIDPQGIVPVGEMAIYEIRIKNNGVSAAKGVNVVAMFSAGVEPSHVEGAQHTISDGRVAFRTMDNLAAGSETILKIHAKATASGTHVFRAEVACDEIGMKLAAEETTRFFTEEDRWADASTAYAEEQGTATR